MWDDAQRGVGLCGGMHTTELFKNYKYLGEIEKEFENALAFLSGALMGSNHEKNIVTHSI